MFAPVAPNNLPHIVDSIRKDFTCHTSTRWFQSWYVHRMSSSLLNPLYQSYCFSYGGFLENKGTNKNHPFLDGIFPYKPTIFLWPLSWNPPDVSILFWSDDQTFQRAPVFLGSTASHLAGGEKAPPEDQSSKGASPKSALAKLGHLRWGISGGSAMVIPPKKNYMWDMSYG